MDFFEKLVFTRRKSEGNKETRKVGRSRQINPEQVRLLLFKECDWRGRKLLFDSATITRETAGKNDRPNVSQTDKVPCIVEVSGGFTYVYNGPATDASLLGEMIFGAVAMNYKNVSLKIHIMDEPRRLMCTKVFCVPVSRRKLRTERKTEVNNNVTGGSEPLYMPSPREEGVSLSFSLDRGDSGFCGDNSPYSSVGSNFDYFSMFDVWDGTNVDHYSFHSLPGRKLSSSSNGSWQRRTFQNIATRFNLGHQSSNLLSVPTSVSNVTSSDSQVYSTSDTCESLSSNSSTVQKKNKLGLALLITVSDSDEMDVIRRCMEHSPQLQALVCRLRLATLAAGVNSVFVSTLYRATVDAAVCLSDLLHGPRLESSWLTLVTSDRQQAIKTADNLLSDLCSVLCVGDTKNTNFFISTLLTHVLTYHLGWVATVSPYDMVDPKPLPPNLKHRPYNALWAQLSDLCGSIGFPQRTAKTIISGTTNIQFVEKLLAVLTYFVRCGDVIRNDYNFQEPMCDVVEKVVCVNTKTSGLKRTCTRANIVQCDIDDNGLSVPLINTQNSDSSVSTLTDSIKQSTTLGNISEKLSKGSVLEDTSKDMPMTSQLRRNPTMMITSTSSSSSLSSSNDEREETKVVFVLGDDEKLVGLKNKSTGGKRVKKSSKVHNEPIVVDPVKKEVCQEDCDKKNSCQHSGSQSKCCGQTLQHSKPIKHSGFKFEFEKYPQIVTNYMKSKNLELLDRHYIGKPGNLKLDNFQFDPMIVPPIQEERCETCYKCQLMESMLQTPTNASEMECMNDLPRQMEPQYAKEALVKDEEHREMSPKTFVRKRKQNTLVVNQAHDSLGSPNVTVQECKPDSNKEKEMKGMEVKQVIEFPVPEMCSGSSKVRIRSGFDATLLGGVTDHYVPDLILQGTKAKPDIWEKQLRLDLELATYLSKSIDSPVQAIAIVGDTNTWEVRIVGRESGAGGMSSLVGGMLDALPAMWRAKVPAYQCLSYLEGKLRELCVLSKTLADMLMTTDFCDIATLTTSLNIDVNDVPLLLAVATTHTPQVATRYGISYR